MGDRSKEFVLLIVFLLAVSFGRCTGNVADESLVEKGKALLHKANNSSAPFYFRQYGKEGVNYNIDEAGRAYIWCEKFSIHDCPSQSEEECTTKVKCFAERRSHRLGCMAVLIHNASSPIDNVTISDTTPTLKDCWSQDASELEECLEDAECVVNSRTTGSKDLAAKFCCCRTHACNQNLTFRFPEPSDEPSLVHSSPTGHWLPVFILSTAGFSVLIVVLVLSSILALCGITYWAIRKRNKHDKFENKLSTNGLSLASVEHGNETSALLRNTTEALREITLLEKASTGRFSEVYKGRLSDNVFAVKVLPAMAIDSWVNEQDVYALKTIRSHPSLVDFIAAFPNNEKYWLVTAYHENGSLSDYLRNNVLSLEVAMKFLSTMLSGLAFLHDESVVGEETKPSVVHRDFKSKNVLIKDDLTTCITDFGLALKCDNGRMSEDSHGQVGTRRYMAPEVLEGATEFSAFAFQQIDVYAAGLVMWEILSRTQVPEDGNDAVPEYLLPYEKEAGPSPSLGQIRELVVMRKFRPEVREAHLLNKSTRTIVKTIREMWDMEPDGRITSGCASDRMARLYESLQSSTPSSGSLEEHDNEACDASS